MQLILSKIRASARILLTLPENDSKRISQGESLLRRLKKFGIIKQDENTLERILTLKIQDFLERRLQTIVFKLGLAYLVRIESQKEISYYYQSPYSGGDPGRVRRKTLKKNDFK